MAEVFFENPPVLTGKSEDQLRQLQNYLFTMSGKLNEALMSISIEQMTPETQQSIRKTDTETKDDRKDYVALKSMIIKTAEIVRTEMDVIATELDKKYEAISSQFGTYEQNLTNTITATAEGILQDYRYEERIQGLESDADDTDGFIRKINQFIFSGLIDEEEGKYGIAIGENITAYDENGNPYINSERKMATFTMDRLSFWQGETEVAYFSDNVFYIAHGEITDTLKMGHHTWQIMPDGSMALTSN